MQMTMVQQPVGQGGLFEGRIEITGSLLRWLYDCGSQQTNSLRREIRNLGVQPVDLVFVSHLHSDHISGIDQLLQRVSVSEVVLPYLKAIDRILLMGNDLKHNQITREFRRFVTSPVDWFFDRGVSRVTFIRGSSDGSPSDGGPDLSPRLSDDGTGPIKYKWSRSARKNMKRGRVRYFDTGASIFVLQNRGAIDWLLAPYSHRPPVGGAHEFLRRLRKRFGTNFSVGDVARALATTNGQSSLRFCYGAISPDQNFVSMSLYSGTQKRGIAGNTIVNLSPPRLLSRATRAGWLSTGDLNLLIDKRRHALLQFYGPLLQQVGIIVLPHHGAASSFSLDLLAAIPHVDIGIAAAGPNPYGRPSPEVRKAVRRCCRFHQVSNMVSSRITLQSGY